MDNKFYQFKDRIAELWGVKTTREICLELGISKPSVITYAKKIGLSSPNPAFSSREGVTRKKCSFDCKCNRHSEELKNKISNLHKGKINSEETRIKMSMAKTGKKIGPQTEEHKQNAVAGQRRNSNYSFNSETWANGKRDLIKWSKFSGFHNGTWMRCINSEGVFARQLDSVGIQWIYEPRRFRLSWGATYFPDFYLPEFDIWIEVKGYMRALAQRKIESFREETGKTLVVVFQHELESMFY